MDVKGGEAIYISLTFRYGNVNHLNIVSYKLKKSNIIGGKGEDSKLALKALRLSPFPPNHPSPLKKLLLLSHVLYFSTNNSYLVIKKKI